MMTKIISKSDLLNNYDMREVIEAVEKVYKKLGEDKIDIPQRVFAKTKKGGDYLYGAATNLEKGTFIVLSSAYLPWNSKKDLPTVTGAYLYSSFETGELLAVVNGEKLVDLRTGAKSAVGARYLARGNSEVLGLIGLGQQAKTQAEAIASEFGLKRIIGWTRNPDKHKDTLEYIKEKTGIEVELEQRDNVVDQSDILVVGTYSKKILVEYDQLQKGQLVISLSHSTEVSPDLVKNARSFVDTYETALSETGPVKAAIEEGFSKKDLGGELSDIISGKKKGRVNDDEIVLLQSLGVMCENLAVVEYIYETVKDKVQDVDL